MPRTERLPKGITKRKGLDGVYRVKVSLGRDPVTGQPMGKERQVGSLTKPATLEEAKRALHELHLSAEVTARAKRLPDTPRTVGELLDRYVEHCETVGRSATTLVTYRGQVEILRPLVGHRSMFTLGPGELDALYGRLRKTTMRGKKSGRSPATVKKHHALLAAAYGYAHKVGWVKENPTDRATIHQQVKYEAVMPSIAQVFQVVERVREKDPTLAMAFHLAIASGCRRGELCALRWSDLVDDALTVRRSLYLWRSDEKRELREKDTKTHAVRPLILDGVTMAAVAEHRAWQWTKLPKGAKQAVDGFVLADLVADAAARIPHDPEWMTRGWKANAKALEVPGRLHDLRHLHLSELVAAGIPMSVVSDRAGHAQESTTANIYSHSLPGADRRASSVMGERIAASRLLSGPSS